MPPSTRNLAISGSALRQRRDSAELSQYELANLAGVSQQMLAGLETGAQQTTHPERARALAAALGCDVADLLVTPEPIGDAA